MPDRVEREVLIEAPVGTVWELITDAKHLAQWFSDEATIDLRPGGTMTLHWHGHGSFPGRVERIDPPHLLEFAWIRRPDASLSEGATRVTISLLPQGDSTLVRVIEDGFDDLGWSADETSQYRGDNEAGWGRELAELRHYAAAQHRQRRG